MRQPHGQLLCKFVHYMKTARADFSARAKFNLSVLYDMGQNEYIFDEHIGDCDRDIHNILREV